MQKSLVQSWKSLKTFGVSPNVGNVIKHPNWLKREQEDQQTQLYSKCSEDITNDYTVDNHHLEKNKLPKRFYFSRESQGKDIRAVDICGLVR